MTDELEERLSEDDLKALINNPTTDAKIGMIEKLSSQYNSKDFSKLQIERAERIFRLLIKDTETEVRQALAENIVTSSLVPKDVVISLAKDVEMVACPVLEFSDVFTDEDLIELVNETTSAAHQSAIANRANVSEGVSEALIDTGSEEVVTSLMKNESAEISDKGYDKVVGNFSESEIVVDSFITRGTATQKIVNKMAAAISDTMKERIEARYKSSFSDINKFFRESSEMAAIKLMGQHTVTEELMLKIDSLENSGTLTKAIDSDDDELMELLANNLGSDGQYPAIPALAVGHLPLFCIILSKLTNVPYLNVTKLILDKKGLEAIYKKANLPDTLLDVVVIAITVLKNIEETEELDYGETLRDNLNLFIKHLAQLSRGRSIKNMSSFISIIQNNIEERHGGW